ncbi:hypothetical protein C0993_005968 [Termitomyces sp. T159_Od127]|nr:hypothetical protein C0993_005968 [Termitomyces sp. T159_Od127]
MPKEKVESNKSTRSQPQASSNWLALQKVWAVVLSSSNANVNVTLQTLGTKNTSTHDFGVERTRKRRKLEHAPSSSVGVPRKCLASSVPNQKEESVPEQDDLRNGESLSELRRMIAGKSTFSDQQKLPGKYLALDCEMVGVGIDGTESSLARVSLVNFYGAIQLDEFVRQRERVVDYRTRYSGIRETDMIKAKPFDDVQKKVAELLKDRILVGHAVYNDLKALLLSHPRPMIRDTQYYAGKYKVVKSKYVALRNLVKQELDVVIQGGEHSSVTDARATMAVFRIHRKEWEKGNKPLPQTKKRKRTEGTADDGDEKEGKDETQAETSLSTFPGGGRKGVSSGLTTIVRRGSGAAGGEKKKWWKEDSMRM